MAELEEFEFDTTPEATVIVLDEQAVHQLSEALATLGAPQGYPLTRRRAILEHEERVPPLLYERFRSMMQRRLGESPVRVKVEEKEIEPLIPHFRVAPTETGLVSARKDRPSKRTLKRLTVEEQIKIKEKRKRDDEREGIAYRDVMPVMKGPTMGSQKGDPTSNIFAIGHHRGTTYMIEQISAPMKMPRAMPKTLSARRRLQEAATAPYIWQARVLGHPWTKVPRSPSIVVPRGTTQDIAKAIRQELAESYRRIEGDGVDDLLSFEFPVFKGKDGWKKSQSDVERAIDTLYKLRHRTGRVPVELEKHIGKKKKAEKEGWGIPTREIRPRGRRKRKAFDPTKRRGDNPGNPGIEAHQKMGEKFLAESEKLWDSYCNTGSGTTLLNAYRALELACQEFEYTGDKARMKQAKSGIRAARNEILSGMKKKTAKKKTKKKTAKKKASKKRTKKKASKKRTK